MSNFPLDKSPRKNRYLLSDTDLVIGVLLTLAIFVIRVWLGFSVSTWLLIAAIGILAIVSFRVFWRLLTR